MTFTPTPAQEAALVAYKTGEHVRITAGAGSGKTATLLHLAESNLDRKCLYIAFNSAVAKEAKSRFPKLNTTCSTVHGLAYTAHGKPLRDRLFPKPAVVKLIQSAAIIGVNSAFVASDGFEGAAASDEHPEGLPRTEPIVVRRSEITTLALATTLNYMRSQDAVIGTKHVSLPARLIGHEHTENLKREIAQYAEIAWKDLTDPNGRLRCSHDVYLKLWALTNPILDFDVIFVDEAQDLNPVMAHIATAQLEHTQVIGVGDSSQAIYDWAGATDWLSAFPAEHEVVLDMSFRFGQDIADESNVWLNLLAAPIRIKGNPAKSSTLVSEMRNPDAILCRTNIGVMGALMSQLEMTTRGVGIVGGTKDLFAQLRGAEDVIQGRRSEWPEFVSFDSWRELVHFAESSEGGELLPFVKLVTKYGGTRAIANAVSRSVKEVDADVVISTAHKAKGRQWPSVLVWSDFREPRPGWPASDADKGMAPEMLTSAEAMLAYVAVTRAEEYLDNRGLKWIHAWKSDDPRLAEMR